MTDSLLQRVVADVAAHGIQDRSLREIARAAGTSHRMLLYHFGSREGLVAAVVAEVEKAQQAMFRDLAAHADSTAALVRALWQRVSSEELRPFVRLFFEAVSHTAGAGSDHLTSPWLDTTQSVAAQLGAAFESDEIRLGVAVVRGLLIDVLVTGETGAATRSLERYIAMWERDRARPPGLAKQPAAPPPAPAGTGSPASAQAGGYPQRLSTESAGIPR
ncbi:MAG TPA: TetR/AcrR family transcriptional regulator [Natronosporangium sp.]|nr:TetR/AcrR family transcriptional regulator [Natronosporangium sp.]